MKLTIDTPGISTLVAAVLGREGQQVGAVEIDGAFGDGESGISGEYLAEGALSGTVGPHYGVDLSAVHCEVYALEYFLAFYSGMEVFYFEKLVHIAV